MQPSDEELELAKSLIDHLSSENFQPENYRDEHRERVLAAIEEKVKGQEVTPSVPRPRPGRTIDLIAALKQSMEKARPRVSPTAAQKKRRTRAS